MKFKRHSGNLGENFPREIVLRGAQAAASDDQIGASRRDGEGLDSGVEIVGNSGVPANDDADFGQPLAQPLAIGVEVLTGRELGPDGNDFGANHGDKYTF